MRRVIVTCVAAPLMASSVMADDWDESINGDLSSQETLPTIINLTLSSNFIRGTIGGSQANTPPEDFTDAFGFTVPAGWSIEAVNLVDFQVSGGNTSTGFNVWRSLNGLNLAGTNTMTTAKIGTDLLDTSNLGGMLGEGNWEISLREGTPGQVYTLEIVVVPAPASAAVLGFGGVLAMRRRR